MLETTLPSQDHDWIITSVSQNFIVTLADGPMIKSVHDYSKIHTSLILRLDRMIRPTAGNLNKKRPQKEN